MKKLTLYGTYLLRRDIRKARRVPVYHWTWRPRDSAGVEKMRAGKVRYPYALATNYAPSKSRQRVVLVFDTGIMSRGFIHWARRYRLKYFFLNYDQFVLRGGEVLFGTDLKRPGSLTFGGATLDTVDVAAVIWTPPSIWSYRGNFFTLELFLSRWQQVLRDLKMIFKSAIWIPGPPLVGAQNCQDKFSEFLLAKELGLNVPETIFTNAADAAQAFYERHHGRVLFRDLGQLNGAYKIGLAKPDFQSLGRAPVVFQQYVEKKYEIRAVVIGNQVFAARIDSQKSTAAAMDWRVYDNARVRWDRMNLPRNVELRLVKLVKRLGLTFSSVDLIKSTDGLIYFLEANRPGAVYWLKPFVGIDAARELMKFIKSVI